MIDNMKSILFNTSMVQAIIHDKKTVTRRVIKYSNSEHDFIGMYKKNTAIFCPGNFRNYDITSPYSLGDILYVRETWYRKDDHYIYRSDYESLQPEGIKWKPSIFMPKDAARIFLKVTNLSVEHLNDISDEEAINEGANFDINGPSYNVGISEKMNRSPVQRFQEIWDSTATKDKYYWYSNPYVWVVHFDKISIDKSNM